MNGAITYFNFLKEAGRCRSERKYTGDLVYLFKSMNAANKIGKTLSNIANIYCGVPQGTILGPVLLCYG